MADKLSKARMPLEPSSATTYGVLISIPTVA